MKYPRIHQAKAIDDTILVIEFTNQEIKKYDVRYLLENPMFAPLRQPAFFKNFKIEPGATGLSGIQISILASMSYGKMVCR